MTKQERIESLTALGFSLQCSSPLPGVDTESRTDWPHVRFSVQLLFKGKLVTDTPYLMGVGCVDWKKAKPDGILQRWTAEEQAVIQTIQSKPHAVLKNKELWAQVAAKLAKYQKVCPDIADLLYSLMSDGQPFFNAESFESWASNYGYDTDSRRAEKGYQTSMETGRKLAAALDKNTRDKVSEIIADM